MVKHKTSGSVTEIWMLPNRSLSWLQSKWVLLLIGGFCLSIAMVWSLLGAWFILPFAGLEVGLLSLVMYLVSRSTYEKQVMILEPETISFQIGRHGPGQTWNFERKKVSILTWETNHPEDVRELYLQDSKQKVRLASFLNLDDQNLLLKHLKDCKVPLKEIKKPVAIAM